MLDQVLKENKDIFETLLKFAKQMETVVENQVQFAKHIKELQTLNMELERELMLLKRKVEMVN